MRRLPLRTIYTENLREHEAENLVLGTVIHAVLRHLPHFESEKDIEKAIKAAKAKGLVPFYLEKNVKDILSKLFSFEDVKKLFSKGIKSEREMEIMDKNGNLYRIDRINFQPDYILIIDFKLAEENENHKKQIRNYMKIVEEIYNKPVKGVLIYVLFGKMVEVN